MEVCFVPSGVRLKMSPPIPAARDIRDVSPMRRPPSIADGDSSLRCAIEDHSIDPESRVA